MSATTFRVSEIPVSVSKEELMILVKGILTCDPGGQNSDVVIVDSSLAPSPADQERFQVATITFACIPDKLRACCGSTGQVRFGITIGSLSTQISFDSHFIGLTPLNDATGGGSYGVE